MLGGGDHPRRRRGQRADHQAEPETGDRQVGVEAWAAEQAEVVVRGQHVDVPVRDQPVAAAAMSRPGERDDAVADPGGEPAAEQRADG